MTKKAIDDISALGYNYYKIKDYQPQSRQHEPLSRDNMIKYYLMAIELNNSDAMTNLAYYYDEIKDYDNMKKYYLMAIELNNSDAMTN